MGYLLLLPILNQVEPPNVLGLHGTLLVLTVLATKSRYRVPHDLDGIVKLANSDVAVSLRR